MAGELSCFELGVEDTERGKTFYSELFGWSIEPGTSGEGYTIGGPDSVAKFGRSRSAGMTRARRLAFTNPRPNLQPLTKLLRKGTLGTMRL